MALPPIQSSHAAPPGRPRRAAESLPVPGNPQAAPRRPAHSPGRIPVAEPAAPPEQADELVRRVDREVRESRDYRILKPYLRERADDEDEPRRAAPEGDDTPDEREARDARAEPAPTPPPGTTAPSPEQDPVQRSDPLALDLDGDGLETTGVEQGVRFDIDADSRPDRTSFVTGGDAFVALDRNGNGLIDDGRELFGDQNGQANGFAALSAHDSNGDGRIDQADPVYARLRLLRLNADGSQQLTDLRAAGVTAIKLAHGDANIAINRYDSIAQSGSFSRNDGTEGLAGDLLLGYRNMA